MYWKETQRVCWTTICLMFPVTLKPFCHHSDKYISLLPTYSQNILNSPYGPLTVCPDPIPLCLVNFKEWIYENGREYFLSKVSEYCDNTVFTTRKNVSKMRKWILLCMLYTAFPCTDQAETRSVGLNQSYSYSASQWSTYVTQMSDRGECICTRG